jgi:hypothetical protein
MSLPESICKLKTFEDWWMCDGRWTHPALYHQLYNLYQLFRFPSVIEGKYYVPIQLKLVKEFHFRSAISIRNCLKILLFHQLIPPFKYTMDSSHSPNGMSEIILEEK